MADSIFGSPSPPPLLANHHPRPPLNLRLALVFSFMFAFLVTMTLLILRYRLQTRRAGHTIEDPDSAQLGSSHLKTGLDASVLNKLPTFKFSETKGAYLWNLSSECAVCLGKFEESERLRLLTRCSHVFHADCIDSWFASHATCPLCRVNLDQLDEYVTELCRPQRTELSNDEATESYEIALLNPTICSSSSVHRTNPLGKMSSSLRFPDDERINGAQVNRCKSDMVVRTSSG